MKKIIAAAMCAVMAGSSAACVSPESIKFVKDGTYTGTAAGYDGDIEVSVVYKDNKLTKIDITKNSEPGVVAYSAMEDIPSYIIENQSVNVDVSTGATTTSKAIMQAVANTVTEAGGNIEQWQTDCTGKHADKVVNYTTQVVIVGGGYAGIVTALRLRQKGISTLLIEKEQKIGGSLNYMFNTLQITANSTSLHKDNIADEEAAKIAADIYTFGNSEGNMDLLNLLANNIGKVTDWQISDLGMAFSESYAKAGYSSNAVRYYNTSDAELYELLTKEVKVSGTKIVTNAAVTGITYENGEATGITAKAVSGNFIKVKADYVILASGSYGTKQNLLNETSSLYYGPLGASGDMVTVGKSETSSFSLLAQQGTARFSTGFKLNDTNAVDSYDAIERCLKSGAFIINQSALRFVNEDADKNTLSNAIASQTSSYIVLNHDAYRAFKAGLLVNMSEAQREAVLGTDTNMDQMYISNSFEEACAKYSLDYNTALSTLNDYNTYVKNKVDIKYGRSASTYSTSIDESKECYIIPISEYVYSTLGGIACNTSLNVIKTDGTALSNVYAVGNVCGNVFGTAMKAGAGSAWAVVSAYLAAENIIEKVIPTPTASPSASASASAGASASAEATPAEAEESPAAETTN